MRSNPMAMMMSLSTLALAGHAGAQLEAKQAPIMTRWAEQVTPDNVHAEYPRPQMVREEWMNLNGVWELAFAEADDRLPVGRTLPQRILVPFPVESALSGVMERAERLWYRRTFQIPENWQGKRILLHFGAVDWEAKVWINGQKAGEHRGGYDAFTFDITDELTGEGPQEIIVGVWDPTSNGTQARGKQVLEPRGIWYTPTTGIWQTVWLEPVSRGHVSAFKIVPDVDDSTVLVQLRGRRPPHRLDVVVYGGGREIARATGDSYVVVPIPEPRLWSPDDPFLYDLEITVARDDDPSHIIDQFRSYFGMRKIEIGPDEKGVQRIMLNGRPIFNIGTLDQGFWPDGIYTAPTDEALRYDVEMTKRLGFNTIRKHVKIEPDRWYYWCDRLGVLVWQDMPSGDAFVGRGQKEIRRSDESARQFEFELVQLLAQHGNHPSIVMWVVFNEGWGQYDTARLAETVRAFDPTRLVNSASGWNDLGVGDVHDMHAYPGPAAPAVEEKRAAVLGEFGGLGLGVDGHTWTEHTWGYRGTEDSDELTRRYEQLLRGVWDLQKNSGLAAAIYTQITDVETECNGLLTYDRAVTKVDVKRVADANLGRVPTLKTVVETARDGEVKWRYTIAKPQAGWEQAGFDDSSWSEGRAGFGSEGTPGAIMGTEWTGSEIWLRRWFVLDDEPAGDVRLFMHHDEDAEVYINGVEAAKVTGYTTAYEEFTLSREARAALKKGRNVIAVHCRQTTGGQYIDVGVVRVVPYRVPRRSTD
ncbi:MAG: hypothetical protein JSV91_04585 [Phycisphaerales bacterium]|nr:MAG: hypothetical protein JSV91_04585 [Phycisphaerales bacterium]